MGQSKVSEIEGIIRNKLEEETKKSIDQLVARMAEETQQAIDRINGVYSSAIGTLEKLELTDATIFDFFQKTNGNIRVEEFDSNWRSTLIVNTDHGDSMIYKNPIFLKEKTRYKIIVMTIEQPVEKEG